MPVGVQRQSALFVLKVYQAKDLPQSKMSAVLFCILKVVNLKSSKGLLTVNRKPLKK